MEQTVENDYHQNRMSSNVCYSKVTFSNIPQISKLLVSVWHTLYGEAGHPLFSEDYLNWIYGGPNRDRHMMIGAWLNDELISYQGFLYRRILYSGKVLNGYLWTHAAVSPELAPSQRVNCAIQLMKQSVLFDKNSSFFVGDCDLVYAFNETDKNTREVVDRVLKKHFGIDRKINSVFNQFVVSPNKLKTYLNGSALKQHSFDVRVATEEEADQLAGLFNEPLQEPQFIMQMSEDELRHHFFGHPDHHTYAVGQGGALKAFINFFPVRIIKESKAHMEVIVEFLISDPTNREHGAHLLLKAVNFAEKIGAKAIVFENANYLDYSVYRSIGLLPTLRKMTMSTFSKEGAFDYSGAFRCDVK